MSKKLIVSGCSWGDPIFLSSAHPTMDTSWPKWPEILAEMMNLEPVNLCMSGMGQEYIYSSLSDALNERPIHSIGHVIAAWSSAPRRDFETTNVWEHTNTLTSRSTLTRWNNIRTDSKGDLRCERLSYCYGGGGGGAGDCRERGLLWVLPCAL